MQRILTTFLFLTLAACDDLDLPGGAQCTLAGCDSGLAATVPLGRSPDSGRYELRYRNGDEAATVTCDYFTYGSGGGSHSCSGDTESLELRIGESAFSVFIRSQPTAGELTVLIDSVTVAQGSFSNAVYQPQYPNGEECGPVCETAAVTLTLSN